MDLRVSARWHFTGAKNIASRPDQLLYPHYLPASGNSRCGLNGGISGLIGSIGGGVNVRLVILVFGGGPLSPRVLLLSMGSLVRSLSGGEVCRGETRVRSLD